MELFISDVYRRQKARRSKWYILVCFDTFFTRLIVYLTTKFLNQKNSFIILSFAFFLGVLESNIFHVLEKTANFFLNIDTVLTYSFYYFAGFVFWERTLFKLVNDVRVFALAIAVVSLIIYQQSINLINFRLDMKNAIYYDLVYIVVVPALFVIIFSNAGVFLKRYRFLSAALTMIGKYSIIIMYLHIAINLTIGQIFNLRLEPLMYCLMGICIPLVIGKIVNNYKWSRTLFLGTNNKIW